MSRLANDRLDHLPTNVRKPAYERAEIRPGIVHIGIGAFHRGHMAVYLDDLLADEPRWGIRGASLRRSNTKAALAPQDYLYTVAVHTKDKPQLRIIGSVLDIIDASGDSAPLIQAIADEDTRVVSLTVTEKGYCHNPATGDLARDHPDIVHDLQNPTRPRSVPGILVAAAATRKDRGGIGLTVLSCDNLHSNGRIARTTVLNMAQLLDPLLAEWIEANFSFPSTMVDRIVPALTEEDLGFVAEHLEMADHWPIVTEPFSQWVVEDDFAAGRPDLPSAGVQLVSDVEPFETMKLRMLNGSHSAMAYLGQLAGHQVVSEAVGDPIIRSFVTSLMTREVIPTLQVAGQDLPGYRDALLERFANPNLRHSLVQIATDGSQKLPPRVLAPMRERLGQGRSIELLALTVAGWIAWLQQVTQSAAIPDDPMGAQLSHALGDITDPRAAMCNAMSIKDIFGTDLANDGRVTETILRHLECIQNKGVHAAILQALCGDPD